MGHVFLYIGYVSSQAMHYSQLQWQIMKILVVQAFAAQNGVYLLQWNHTTYNINTT